MEHDCFVCESRGLDPSCVFGRKFSSHPERVQIFEFVESFGELQTKVHDNAVEKGFWESDRSIGECIALIHSELSEALEAARKPGIDQHLPHLNPIAVELADAVIRIMDLAESKDLNLAEAIVEKHEYNRTRPYLHGKRY